MDKKGGFKIVGGEGGNLPGSDGEPELGATGFYYVAPADAWDDTALAGRRPFAGLITLPLYIWRELLKGVILSMVVFSVILMAVFAGQVMRDGIGAYTLLKVLPNFLPLICPFVLPLAMITGILICYSRLSRDNEVLAAYAGGVNPVWLVLPAILTSIIAIFVTLTLNEVALLPAIRSIERLVIDDQANILRRMISRPGNITVQTGSEFIAMSKLAPGDDSENSGQAPLDITRFESARRGANTGMWDRRYPYPSKRVVARDHEVLDFSDVAGDELVIKMQVGKPVFQDLHISDINRTTIADGESGEERLTLGGRPRVTIHANRSSFWPILLLTETRRQAEEDIRDIESSNVSLDNLPPAQKAELTERLRSLRSTVRNRTSEVNMRLALCFSCFAFAILGIPLGMRTRGTLATSFVAGIVTAGVYFLALKSAEIQVSRGLMEYWVIWIPDVLVVLFGLVLWWRNFRAT